MSLRGVTVIDLRDITPGYFDTDLEVAHGLDDLRRCDDGECVRILVRTALGPSRRNLDQICQHVSRLRIQIEGERETKTAWLHAIRAAIAEASE